MLLIAYDGSENAKAAIETAARLMPGTEAVILTVWEPYAGTLARTGAGSLAGMTATAFPDLDQQAREHAERVAAEGQQLATAAGLTANARIVPCEATTAAPVILDAAEELGADAIVVGTRGHGAVKSFVLGSTSHGVLNHATRPVILVPVPRD